MLQQEPIVLTQEPSLPALFAKAALKRGSRSDAGITLPALKIVVKGIKVNPRRLRRYQKVCGFQETRELPLTFPQIMTFAAQMHLMTDERFPLPLIGLVHLRNEISQQRPILPEEVLDFHCAIAGQRESDKGLEFDVVTRVIVAGRLVWESTATYLYRRKSPSTSPRKAEEKPAIRHDQRQHWHLPESIGRRYARVSGDFNLIHLHPLTARLFGFNRAIAHGMWTKARCVAELLDAKHPGPVRVAVQFKLPVFLPGDVDLAWHWRDSSCSFELLGHTNDKPHLTGVIELLEH